MRGRTLAGTIRCEKRQPADGRKHSHNSVSDTRSGELYLLDVENDKALDVFYHPFAHAALQAAA
jgi:hypothetical protein